MDALKKNGFMLVVGLIVLAAAALFGMRWVMVESDISEAKKTLDGSKIKLKGIGGNQPNQQWPPKYEEYAREAQRALSACRNEYGATNDKLEMWADENGKPKAAERPPGGEGPWKARCHDRGVELRKMLEAKGIKVCMEPRPGFGGRGEREEGGLYFVDPNEMKQDLRVYQKQWWIQERLVAAILESSNIVRLEKVEFPAPEAAPVDPFATPAPVPPGGPQPAAEPLYEKPAVIKARFQLQIMFGDVSKFVANLIKMDKTWPIRFANVDLQVSKLASFEGKPTDLEDTPEEVSDDVYKSGKWKPTQDPLPPPVRVVVSADVLEFNIPQDKRQ